MRSSPLRSATLSLVLRAASLAPIVLGLVGCDGDATEVDARYSTPEHTLHTLFTAYGVESLSQDDIRLRMAAHSRFEIRDRASYEACFADLRTPTDEGLAGFVFGSLAAAKDDLRVSIAGDRATVMPAEAVRIVLLREDDGRWRISLAESVPDAVRQRMGLVTAEAEQRERRGVSTQTTP